MATTKKKTRAKRSSKPAGKAPNPSFAFLLDYMKKHPKAAYGDAAAAAATAGHKLYPIVWGRAQALLGRVKSKPRGTGATAMARKASEAGQAPPPKARRGRPPKQATAGRVGRPRKAAASSFANGTFPVAEGDLPRMAALVDALNDGGKAVLRYVGGGWELAIE